MPQYECLLVEDKGDGVVLFTFATSVDERLTRLIA